MSHSDAGALTAWVVPVQGEERANKKAKMSTPKGEARPEQVGIRASKKAATLTPKRATWTDEIIESLLEIRYSEVSKAKFNRCQSNKQKAAWWAWLVSRLSVRSDVVLTSKQLKTRFNSLKSEYRAIVNAKKETGNSGDRIKFPTYWDTLCAYMQVVCVCRVFHGCCVF